MARRPIGKTKKRKKTTRKPTRKVSKGPGVFQKSLESLARGVVSAARFVTPSKETSKTIATNAWHSRSVRRICGLVGAAVVCVGIAWVTQQSLRTEHRYQIDPGRFALDTSVDWAKNSLAESIRTDIENDIRADLSELEMTDAFDTSAHEILAEKLGGNAWVRSVVRIDRMFPDNADAHATLVPTLEIRKPVIVIEQESRVILIDGDGVVLPIELKVGSSEYSEFQSNLAAPLRRVVGVTGLPPSAGTAWENQQITAAISMERVIRKSALNEAVHIDAIELIGVPEKSDARGRLHYQPGGGVVLIPDTSLLPGTRLIWGRPPIHASTLELSPNDKLDQLKQYLSQPESLPGASIDLRKRS
ncbi:hypothetical protein OAU50_06275 [Planctomycetota bacterium]|nr:hypothetical protein [Planctomycetota bacterium]